MKPWNSKTNLDLRRLPWFLSFPFIPWNLSNRSWWHESSIVICWGQPPQYYRWQMRLYEKSKLYVVYIYICIYVLKSFYLFWRGSLTHYFLEAKISRPFIFRWKWLPFLFLELFFFVGIRWKYGDGWRSRRLGITVTDEKDSDGLLTI